MAGRLRDHGGAIPLPHPPPALGVADGYSDQIGHVFLATGLQQGPVAREASEQGMICRAIPLAELEQMIRSGMLEDAISLAALGMLRIRGLL